MGLTISITLHGMFLSKICYNWNVHLKILEHLISWKAINHYFVPFKMKMVML